MLVRMETGASGGGGLTPTFLWTNSAPTSNFAASDATLSEDINNFEYIGITVKRTTSSGDQYDAEYMYKVSDILKTPSPISYLCIGSFSGNYAQNYIRGFYYHTATTIYFYDAYYQGTKSNDGAIPKLIVGYK